LNEKSFSIHKQECIYKKLSKICIFFFTVYSVRGAVGGASLTSIRAYSSLGKISKGGRVGLKELALFTQAQIKVFIGSDVGMNGTRPAWFQPVIYNRFYLDNLSSTVL
jgi:hypothetical protein